MYRLFLDDIRYPPGQGWEIVRSFEEACTFVLEKGIPSHISFDHDLGLEETGYDFAKWLVNSHLDAIISIPDNFTFKVHSANPVGAENIQRLMDNFLLEIRK